MKGKELAEKNLTAMEIRYRTGQEDIGDLMDAHTVLTRARANYLEAAIEHCLATAELSKMTGSLGKETIPEIKKEN